MITLPCHYHNVALSLLQRIWSIFQSSVRGGVKHERKKTKKVSRKIFFHSRKANVCKSSVNNARGFIAPSSGQELIYCADRLDRKLLF